MRTLKVEINLNILHAINFDRGFEADFSKTVLMLGQKWNVPLCNLRDGR